MFLTPEVARTKSQREKFGFEGIYHPARIAWLRDAILSESLTGSMLAKWNIVKNRPAEYIMSGPPSEWTFPPYYQNPTAHELTYAKIKDDVKAAVDYALRFTLFGNDKDAMQAVKIIRAYSDIKTFTDADDGPLVFYFCWPLLIQAHGLLYETEIYRPIDRIRFKEQTLRAYNSFEKIAYTKTNNWATAGITGEIAIASLFKDRAQFDNAIRQWRLNFDDAVKSGITLQGAVRNNIPIHEIYRQGGSQGNGESGLVYSSQALKGWAVAAEWARLNGEWLYDYVSPDGSSLKGLYENVANWLANPTPENLWFNTSGNVQGLTYIHPWVDILAALWPNADSDYLIANKPLADSQDHTAMHATELFYRDRPLYG